MNEDNKEAKIEASAKPTKTKKAGISGVLVGYIIVGVLSGMLGAGFYGQYVSRDLVKSNGTSAGSKVTVLEQSAVIDLVKKVSPSVVSITSSSKATDFFGQNQQQTGAGTGMIVTEDGLILTNKHVIEGADSLTVITTDSDGKTKEYKNAKVVAQDPSNDLAFVRIDAKGLSPVELGDSSQVQVGQSVVAIGNALGQFQNSVTTGVISGRRQSIQAGTEQSQETLNNIFQTDAAINPGNSGGPLVNIAGQVIGINTAVAGEGAQNIGFAIPINEAKSDFDTVRQNGKITRPLLGVRYVLVTNELAARNNLSVDHGALVVGNNGSAAIVAGSPADKAGLKENDIITKIGDTEINADNSLSTVVATHKPGDKVEVTYVRDGKEQKTTVTLGEADSTTQ